MKLGANWAAAGNSGCWRSWLTFGVAHPERTTTIRAHRRAIAGVLDGLVDGIVCRYEPGLLNGV